MSKKIFGHELTGAEETFFWIAAGITILSSAMLFLMSMMWIYYSWIKRENSKNWTGGDLTRHMLNNANLQDVEVRPAWLYLKYWNFNKRRKTHKLRPWTNDRRSIWTMMEAGQQAYATTIRASKGATYWMLFRMPGFIRALGLVAQIALTTWAIQDKSGGSTIDSFTYSQWLKISIGISIVFISFMIAECGKLWILYKNVPKIIEEAGFNQEEVKSIRRIYFWRFVIAIVQVILEIVRLVIQIASESKVNNSK